MNAVEKRRWQRRRQHRQVMRYRERRIALIVKLGARCDECGETNLKVLEFDHLNPREWVCRDKSRWVRIKLYEEEAERGEIRLLCRSCNARTRPGRSARKKHHSQSTSGHAVLSSVPAGCEIVNADT